MAMIGGMMCDYDVFPNPDILPDIMSGYSEIQDHPDRLTFYSGCPCPAFVAGNAEEYEKIVQLFLGHSRATPVDQNNASDQNILALHPEMFDTKRLMSEVFTDDWESFPFVHFPNHRMRHLGPREDSIPRLLDSL